MTLPFVEGLYREFQYNAAAAANFFTYYTRFRGLLETPDAAPTYEIFNPAGTSIATGTMSGASSTYLFSQATTDTAVWTKGYNYRLEVSWAKSSTNVVDNIFVDVVGWPYRHPLISGEELDVLHPTWAARRPSSWTDWQNPIVAGMIKLHTDLRQMKGSDGEYLYPSRIIDRAQLKLTELSYIEREIAGELRMSKEEKDRIFANARDAIPEFLFIDIDDDLVIDDDEDLATGITLVR